MEVVLGRGIERMVKYSETYVRHSKGPISKPERSTRQEEVRLLLGIKKYYDSFAFRGVRLKTAIDQAKEVNMPKKTLRDCRKV